MPVQKNDDKFVFKKFKMQNLYENSTRKHLFQGIYKSDFGS